MIGRRHIAAATVSQEAPLKLGEPFPYESRKHAGHSALHSPLLPCIHNDSNAAPTWNISNSRYWITNNYVIDNHKFCVTLPIDDTDISIW